MIKLDVDVSSIVFDLCEALIERCELVGCHSLSQALLSLSNDGSDTIRAAYRTFFDLAILIFKDPTSLTAMLAPEFV